MMYKQWLFLLLTVVLWWGVTAFVPAQEKETPASKIDPRAKELMTQAAYNLMETKGFHFEFRMQAEVNYIDGKNLCEFEALTTGIYQQSGLTYFRTRARDQELELYQYEELFVSRDTPEADWTQATTLQQLPSPKDTMTLMMDNLDYARLGKQERIKGLNCQILEIGLTATGLKRLIETQAPEIMTMGTTPQISNLTAAVGVNDGNLYKLGYTMEITPKSEETSEEAPIVPEKMSTKIVLQISLFGYDRNIDIKLPDQVKELLNIEELEEEPIEEPTEESVEEPLEEPTDNSTEEPVEEPTEEPTKEPTEEPFEEESSDEPDEE